jgi:thymidylate kinase
LDETWAIDLVAKLCRALAEENVNYCHWKSNEALARSASGENDLDLLVSRADGQKMTEILSRLGFREAQDEADHSLPGVMNYYGYDARADRLIHVHLHYQLVLGNDLNKNYRIPVERAYLDLSTRLSLFRVPAPEFELVIFVIRMVLKHSTWDSILVGHGSLSPSEQREFKSLATVANLEKAKILLDRYLPYLSPVLFKDCVQALQPGCPLGKRIRAGEQLQNALKPCARFAKMRDITLRLWRRFWWPVQSRLFHRRSKRHLAHGGMLIAVVGGDGSGKTTVINGLEAWLSKKFEVTRLHMGKPRWSVLTILVRGLLKIGTLLHLHSFKEYSYEDPSQFPGNAWLVRTVCTAHDRYRAYLMARRIASNGGLVICDRYPLPGFLAMDAPQCAGIMKRFERSGRFLKWLKSLEQGWYRQIAMPDLLIVLRLDPEIAVERKTDESPASVRARSTLVWEMDWNGMPAHILNASLAREEVLAQAKWLVWQHL